MERLKIGEEVGQKWLHIAGNDANYTLRALLLSAACQFELDTEVEGEYLERLETIKKVALGNIPDMVRTGGKRMRIRGEFDVRMREAELGIGNSLDDMDAGWGDLLFMQEVRQEGKVKGREDDR